MWDLGLESRAHLKEYNMWGLCEGLCLFEKTTIPTDVITVAGGRMVSFEISSAVVERGAFKNFKTGAKSPQP